MFMKIYKTTCIKVVYIHIVLILQTIISNDTIIEGLKETDNLDN